MSARRVAAVARRVVRQFRHDRRSLGLLFIVPLILLSLIGYLWRPGGDREHVPVAIVNEDGGPLGGIFADALRSGGSLDARTLDADAGARALQDGQVNAVIRFPSTFSDDALRGQRLALAVRLEGSDPFVNASTLAAVQKTAVESLSAALARTPFGGGRGGVALEVSYLYGGADYGTLDYLAPVLIPFLAFFLVFLLTDVAFLRERASGTLERLLASPLRRGELVAGYVLGLALFALAQTLVVVVFTVVVLGVRYRGNVAAIFAVEAVMVLGAVSLGLLVSAFARNEFQAVQFMPLVVLPQVLLSGIFIPIQELPELLRPLAWIFPLTYTNEALRSVMVKGAGLGDPLVLRDIAVLLAFALVAAAGATATIRREVA